MNTYDVIGAAGVSLIAVALVLLVQFLMGRKSGRPTWPLFYGAGLVLIAVAAIWQVVAP